ncbi:ABC transporter permease [Yimella sp. NH-Cas1]|uniref:ABC transporter permease n=1 Tax=Yimella sp. NH-Cas1 TaxID=2917726 RepID=UPI001EFAE5C1|nr:ABC transporter permease [Yimella sp. NH-Cas1]MCG8654519.1 ABC transporter permease [Yimella sp. NH-Cas1]
MTGMYHSELLKTRTGRAPIGTFLGGLAMCLLTAYGFLTEGQKNPISLTDGTTTGEMVRGWMMMMLFAAVLAAILVTREFGAGTIGRSVLMAGRDNVFRVKMTVILIIGLVLGVLTSALAAATTYLMLNASHGSVTWTTDATYSALGVGGCVVLSAVAGGLVGWIMRNTTLASVVIVVSYVVLDPAIQRVVPGVAKYLFSIALTSLYGDPKPDLLSRPAALAVCLVWIVALGLLARTLLHRKEV